MLTEGPLGFPCSTQQAHFIEDFMKRAVGGYQHAVIHGKTLETAPSSRTDISWITTEMADRYNHVVLADGMDDTAYLANPIVTLNHNYDLPPIGRSLWRKTARVAGTKGVQAMTYYPPRPPELTGDWPPDTAFAQVLAGLLNAKSIGFIPLAIQEPDNPDMPLIIQKWALVEYACGTVPVNPQTTVIQVTKSMPPPPPPHAPTPPDLAVSIAAAIAKIDLDKIIQNSLDRLKGVI
jgi:hypothetical protein